MNGLGACVADGCGVGAVAAAVGSEGFGDNVLDVDASGAVEDGREGGFVEAGPPSFASLFARIWLISLSAGLFAGTLAELTLSASDMASCGGGGGGCSSAMLCG